MEYGIVNGMILRIDKAGRVVVPKLVRERLGLTPDTELEVLEQPDGVLLRPVEQRPSMVNVNGFWVHQGVAPEGFDWDRAIADAREERIQTLTKL
jgi:AbrB family looped-hinge helix DNA binding protein